MGTIYDLYNIIAFTAASFIFKCCRKSIFNAYTLFLLVLIILSLSLYGLRRVCNSDTVHRTIA